jgi:hypothetical protein
MAHMLDHLTADMTNVKLLPLDFNFDCSKVGTGLLDIINVEIN